MIQMSLTLPLFCYQPTLPAQSDGINARLDDIKKQVIALKDLFFGICEGDGYFRSLWSLQEVRLLKKQYFVDADDNAYDLAFEKGTKSNASFLHLAVIATFLTSQLSLALAVTNGSSATAARARVKANPNLVALCQRGSDDRREIEEAMRKLKGCGMALAPSETPLQVLAAARRSRFPSLRPQDNYHAMKGALALDGDFAWDDAKVNYNAALPDQQKEFFRLLIKKYQWKMLQLAKSPADPASGWGGVSLGHFEPVAAFHEGFIVNKLAITGLSTYLMPSLVYDSAADVVGMKPFTDLKTFTAWKMPTDLASLDHITYKLADNATWFNVEEDPLSWPSKSQIAEAKKVETVRLTNNGNGNATPLLIPLMPISDTWSQLNTEKADPTGTASARCLMVEILADPVNGSYSAAFGRIMDVRALKVSEVPVAEMKLKWQK
jgi:hypothetical protein